LPFKKTQPRLRLLTSVLCLVIATLILFWGSAFKASLYHTLHDLGHITTAKLLTEHERPAHADIIATSKSDFPPAPPAINIRAYTSGNERPPQLKRMHFPEELPCVDL